MSTCKFQKTLPGKTLRRFHPGRDEIFKGLRSNNLRRQPNHWDFMSDFLKVQLEELPSEPTIKGPISMFGAERGLARAKQDATARL